MFCVCLSQCTSAQLPQMAEGGDVAALLQALAAAGSSGESAEQVLARLQAQAQGLLASGPAPAAPAEDDPVRKTDATAVEETVQAPEPEVPAASIKAHGNNTHTEGVDVAILQASPLVMVKSGGSAGGGSNSAGNTLVTVPGAPLELASERRLILKSLRESTRALKVVVSPATVDTLQRVWLVSVASRNVAL